MASKRRKKNPKTDNPSAAVDSNNESDYPQTLTEIEKALLGSILLDPEVFDEVILLVGADDFHVRKHQIIFRHLTEMRCCDIPVDCLLLRQRLEENGDYAQVGGDAYITDLTHAVRSTSHAFHYASVLRQHGVMERLKITTARLVKETVELNNVVESLELRVLDQSISIDNSARRRPILSAKDLVDELFQQTDPAMLRNCLYSIPTGFYELDCITGGFYPGNVIHLIGCKDVGKTSLALNIMNYVGCIHKEPALMVSCSHTPAQLATRLFTSIGRVHFGKWKTGEFTEYEVERLHDVRNTLNDSPMFFDRLVIRDVTEIAVIARRLTRQHNLRFLIVDECELLATGPKQDINLLTKRLKSLARELHLPILCLVRITPGQGVPGKEDPFHSAMENYQRNCTEKPDVLLSLHQPPCEEEVGSHPHRLVIHDQGDDAKEVPTCLIWSPDHLAFSQVVSTQLEFEDFYNDDYFSSDDEQIPF